MKRSRFNEEQIVAILKQQETRLVPIPAPGSVARDLFDRQFDLPDAMRFAIDFTYWLYPLLVIVPDGARDIGQKS